MVDRIKQLSEKERERIQKQLPMEEEMIDLANFFSIFGDSTRMRIIAALRHCPMNVGDLAQVLQMSDSAVSHQLRILRQHDLVRGKREGKYIYYALSDEHVTHIFDMGVEHLLTE